MSTDSKLLWPPLHLRPVNLLTLGRNDMTTAIGNSHLIGTETLDHIRMSLQYVIENETKYFCDDFELDEVPQAHEFTEEQKGYIFYNAWQAWGDLGFNRG